VTEQEFLDRVMQIAALYGWHAWHPRPARTSRGWRTAGTGDVGVPDLLLARGGHVILAELKSDRGRLGPGQGDWLDALGDHGRLWRPRDWDRVLATLQQAHKPAHTRQ
jgi:hypothetical protein